MSHRSKRQTGATAPHPVAEELYRAVFDQAAYGIFIANPQGHFTDVNRQGCDMLGYSHAEMLTLSLQDLIPTEDLAHDPPRLADLRAGQTVVKERSCAARMAMSCCVEISARMLSDGSLLGIVRDISERKQAEERLGDTVARCGAKSRFHRHHQHCRGY